jgi:hypothetical protein
MRSPLKLLLITGSLLAFSLGAAVSANAATTSTPGVGTQDFACSNGVCQVGPGNVGTPFGAELYGTGGPAYYGVDCPYIISIVSGSLPPGLTLSACGEYQTITGTPTTAGTYPFTVQITSAAGGPSGIQQLTITIGTGSSDRIGDVSAGFNGHLAKLNVGGFDANAGLSYSVTMTSTGKVIFPAQVPAWTNGSWELSARIADPCPAGQTCSLTVTDSLGSSVTASLPPPKY